MDPSAATRSRRCVALRRLPRASGPLPPPACGCGPVACLLSAAARLVIVRSVAVGGEWTADAASPGLRLTLLGGAPPGPPTRDRAGAEGSKARTSTPATPSSSRSLLRSSQSRTPHRNYRPRLAHRLPPGPGRHLAGACVAAAGQRRGSADRGPLCGISLVGRTLLRRTLAQTEDERRAANGWTHVDERRREARAPG